MTECICKGSIFAGHAPHRNMGYMLYLRTNREEELKEIFKEKLEKHPGDREIAKWISLLEEKQYDRLGIRLLEDVRICPKHASRSIFLGNRA